MPAEFNEEKAYAAQEETFFDDGREEELVKFVTTDPDKDKIKGSAENVLRMIDEFGRTKKYLMNVGEDKGKIVTDIIRERKPNVMIELGGYVGYSTILFGAALRDAGGKQYISLERSPKFAKVIQQLVAFAGLDDVKLHARGIHTIGMMFLDHYKTAYMTDLKLCENLGMIKKATVLAADNVIKPGNPAYLEYVRGSVEEKRMRLIKESKMYTDAFISRTAAQYGEVEVLEQEAQGNPNLIYESRLIHIFEPTGEPDGVEITICLGGAKP